MLTAIILKHIRELNDTLVIAQLPSGDQVSFRVSSQTQAIGVLRELSIKRDVTKDMDPVVDGPVDLDPKAQVPPTQEEVDRNKWFTDYASERTQQILATLSPSLQARYKPEYGDVR